MIAELLHGTESPQTARQLAVRLGCDRRTVFFLISKEREEGKPILADSRGIWLSGSDEETADYYARKLRQVRRTLGTLKPLRIAGQTMPGQIDIEGVEV